MIHAIINGKAGRNFSRCSQDNNPSETETRINLRSLFKESEDSLTAMVFGRLFYLPDQMLWEILWKACGQQGEPSDAGKILEIAFWPRWKMDDTVGASTREPDLFIRFENFDLIIEAKRFDGLQQRSVQWKEQIDAWNNVYDGKTLYFMAVGLNKSPDNHGIDGVDKWLFCKWHSLLNQIICELEDVEGNKSKPRHVKDLLRDLRAGFELHGYFETKWLEDMPSEKVSKFNQLITNSEVEMDSKLEINSSLLDVRKAYRLLFSYQERVRSLIKYLAYKLDFGYENGNALFSRPWKPGSKDNLDFWSWDFLPMYYFEFHLGSKKIGNDIIRMSIFLQSDTGYFDGETEDRLKVENFASVEDSKTSLIFLVGKNEWTFKDFHDCSRELLNSKKTPGRLDNTDNSKSSFSIWYACDLSDFANQHKTDTSVKNFLEFCKNEGIQINS